MRFTLSTRCIDEHFDDDGIRLPLLHEMVTWRHWTLHRTAWISGKRSMEYKKLGAPADLILPISRQLRSILRTQASPLELYYCKQAVRKLEGERRRLR